MGIYDIFVAKYNPDGKMEWVSSAGGGGENMGFNIASLSDGSSKVTGHYMGTVTFGSGEKNETVLQPLGDVYDDDTDIFVASYNPDGTLAWVTSGGSDGSDRGKGVASYADDGSSFVTGYFLGSATFGSGETNETLLSSESGVDDLEVFTARYNANGTLNWAKSAGGEENDLARAIDNISDGSFLVAGDFKGVATFGEGETNETALEATSD